MEIDYEGNRLAVAEVEGTTYLLDEKETDKNGNFIFEVIENGSHLDYKPESHKVRLSERRANTFKSYREVVEEVLSDYGVNSDHFDSESEEKMMNKIDALEV